MNIVVLGAGAIGSVFGGLLARAGHRVTLIGRQPHMNAIMEHGLVIDGIWGEHLVENLACYTSVEFMPEKERAACELALVTVKSYDTDDLLSGCVRLFPDSVTFVSLQNGLGNIECIAAHAGCSRVIGGRVIFGVVFVENGHVRVTVEADKTALGVPATGTADRKLAEHIVNMFSQAGIGCSVTDSIDRLLWGKMLYNCALNAPATILTTHYGSLLETGLQDVMQGIIDEIFHVAGCCGIELPYDSPRAYTHILFDRLVPLTYDHVPSMLHDIRRNKRTEIDSLNGYIVKLARQHGCQVPYNSVVVALVKAMELIRRKACVCVEEDRQL
jgi:2-dehydropantoate 2-reductase